MLNEKRKRGVESVFRRALCVCVWEHFHFFPFSFYNLCGHLSCPSIHCLSHCCIFELASDHHQAARARSIHCVCLSVCLCNASHTLNIHTLRCWIHMGVIFTFPFNGPFDYVRSRVMSCQENTKMLRESESARAANWNNIHHIRIAWIDNFSCEFEMYNSWADWRCGRLGHLGTMITWRDFRSSEEFITVFCSTREDLLHAFIIINHNCI